MGRITTSAPACDNSDIGNNGASAHEPDINKGKAKGARNSCRETIERGRKSTEVVASKRYPLRSALSSDRVLHSGSTKNNKACSEPLNDSAATQPAVRKRKSGSPLGSSNNSVRVLRSTSKNENEACSETLYDTAAEPATNKRKSVSPSKVGSPNNSVRMLRTTLKNKNGSSSEVGSPLYAAEPAANKRKGVSPSKVESPNNSVRVLRSALKNKDGSSSEVGSPLHAAEPAANKRKGVSPSKVGSPNNSVRVLRSALKNKDGSSSEVGSPLYNSTVAQPAAKKRKIVSPSKVGSPESSVRVLRSASENNNEACNDSLNDSAAAQSAVENRKSGRPLAESRNNSVRVLRSASKKKNEACSEPLNGSTLAQPAVRETKGGRPSKERSPKKDYLKIRQRVRYVLNRMNYEQSLIQAYASEGWKGQSLEKIRPEKELERAKAEILRCKLRIREAFQNMDSLLSEGKLEESLFDSAGEICSEDIFCAVCCSKDVTLQNDIILCDGACDRGFHQNCLDPPLLAEDIPVGDEGWFCPACVCKIDCIDALNELQGSKLSILDSWEKVFPEAASLANGSKQIDASDLPSHVSEDNGKNPALAERHVSENRCSAEDEGKVDDLGLASEDSEDVDFDPAGPDSSEDESNSNESDFTSDSDYFCAEIAKSCGQDEVLVSPLSDVINRTDRMKISSDHSNGENSNHAFLDTELEQDMVLPVSSRRQVERLDYKKLYDEAYGEESSNSSDKEEWSGKEKLEDSETDGSFHPAKRRSRRASDRHPSNQHTQSERLCGSVSEPQTEVLHSNGGCSTARKHRFDPIIKQKLMVHYEKDPYPSRTTKETLAQQLGLTFIQVHKWFSTTRHSSRVAATKKVKRPGNHTTENNDSTPVNSTQTRELNDEVRTADGNGMIYEEAMVQNNLHKGNKEDTPLSGGETEMEACGKESSDSSADEEWSGISTPQKEELEDTEIDSIAKSLNPAKRRSRRAPVGQKNDEHTPGCERLHGSVNEQQTEALRSNGSSSTARKYRFGQKLKVQFEKDPYPSRTIMESLAQELGLTFLQVRKWFSSARYSSKVAAKKEKHPGNHTTEKNDSTPVESIQVKEPNDTVMEKLTADRNHMVSEKLMLHINLNEGNEEDLNQFTSWQQTVVMTPTTISREVSPPGYRPGENQGNCALWNTSSEERVVMTPIISRELGPPGYGPGENQGSYASWNISSEQRVDMAPTSISMEVGPPGYVPEENQGNGASWNTSSELRVDLTPTTISRDVGPPGYGPGESHGNYASWTSSELRVDLTPTTIPREVGPPGYGPGENQGEGASWNTSCEQRVYVTPTTISREAGPPGYGPGESQGNYASWTSSEQRVDLTPTAIPREVGPPGYGPGENQAGGASWNTSCEQRVFMIPTTTIPREAGPPGYWPGENQGSGTGASKNIGSPKGRSAEKVELADEARRKAIQRELRRMKKFK